MECLINRMAQDNYFLDDNFMAINLNYKLIIKSYIAHVEKRVNPFFKVGYYI